MMTSTSPQPVIPWSTGRLSRFIVDFDTRDYQRSVPTDETSMQKRVMDLLYAKNGHYDDADLVPYGRVDHHPNLYYLFCQTVPRLLDVGPPLLRKVTLRMHLLDRDPDTKISMLLEKSPLLSQVTFVGHLKHHDRIACALMALAKNQSNRQLRKLIFRDMRILHPTVGAARGVRSALIRLQSLREIQFINSDEALDVLCEAIAHHIGLESLLFQRTPFKLTKTMEQCLTSLPNLRSLKTQLWTSLPVSTIKNLTKLVLDPSEGRGDNRTSRFFLRHAENLIELDLGESNREVEALFLRADLSKLTQLESIKCGRLTVDFLAQWSQLNYLHCTAGLPVGLSMEPLLGEHSTLKSLKLNLVVETEILEALRLMATNETIEDLEIRKCIRAGRPAFASSRQSLCLLRKMLRNNKTLSRLAFHIDDYTVPTIAHALKNNECSLTSLSLKTDLNASNYVFPPGVAELFDALRSYKKLQSLSLDYDKQRLPPPTFDALVCAIPILRLTELKIRCYWHGIPVDDIDQMAKAFNQNTTLMNIEYVNRDTESEINMLDYVARFFRKRNRINAMAQQHQITPGILPYILQSVSSDYSALFLATEHVNWSGVDLIGKRQAPAPTTTSAKADPRQQPPTTATKRLRHNSARPSPTLSK